VGVRATGRALVLAAALTTGLAVLPAGSTAAVVQQAPSRTYQNPISRDFADTYADPSVIKAKDGYWYAYATSDPLREGQTEIVPMHVARSADLVRWEYLGPIFSAANRPAWADPTSFFWAPDIRFLNGRYVLYYTVTNTADNPGDDSAIGVATAPTPAGPWTDSGGPVVAPRAAPGGGYLWTFDPTQLNAVDGRRYLYYGSYFGGIHVTELSADGLRAVGSPTQVTIDNRYEGAYVVRHGGWYYLFASAANCCAGPTTGYSVFAGRSRSPRGPFVDREGVSLLTSRVGGTPVIMPNGNRWVGPGHNAVLTDLAGQDYFVYHAIDRRDPYLNGTEGINERPMLMDRLDWIGGWPTVRAGAWASEGRQPAPVTRGRVFARFGPGAGLAGWTPVRGTWQLAAGGPVSRGHLRQTSGRAGLLLARASVAGDVRVEADVRVPAAGSAAGVVARYGGPGDSVSARLDRGARALVVDVTTSGVRGSVSARLPAGFRYDTWHNVAVELRGRSLWATVTSARLGDPIAEVRLALPRALRGGAVGLLSRGGPAAFDNVSAAALATPVRRAVPDPRVGRLAPAYSDEFSGGAPGAGWTWVRQDPDAQVVGGVLRWPTQAADLVGTGNDAGLLLREAPAGAYTVEVKVTIDLGVDTVRNFQQAGLVAYVNDDEWLRLSHVAIWNTRQNEFGKETLYAGRTQFGGMVLGPPADTTWLRLSHRLDPMTGEHEYRAATSRDGRRWTWGGVWTLPAGTSPRIGLVAHGGDTPQATAEFDYVRVYRP